MSKEKPAVISIGYAKQALQPETRERARMLAYASVLDEYHVIVFTKKSAGFPSVQQVGNLFLHATNARTRPGMLWRAYRIGRKIIKEGKGKRYIVSSQDPFETALVGRAVAGGNRATYHLQIHGDVFNPHSSTTSLLQRLRTLYARYVVRHTSSVRVVSERIKRSLEALGAPAEAITVLPIQSDLSKFLAVGERRTYLSQRPPSFLYLGRFAPEKNLPLLIHAFAQAVQGQTGPMLTLVGAGSEQPMLERLITTLGVSGCVRIQPWTEDVPAMLATHDVFCLSSNHEGWGMVLVEAAAAGMPSITTDVGCAGEFVRPDENGFVVPVGDITAYRDAITAHLKNPGLIPAQGRRGHQLAQAEARSESEYLRQFVESYTSSVAEKPAILEG